MKLTTKRIIFVFAGLFLTSAIARSADNLTLQNSTRQIVITQSYLRLPINNRGVKRHLTFVVEGKPEPTLIIQLADGPPDWWAIRDVTAFKGKQVTLTVDPPLPQDSTALTAIDQADQSTTSAVLYQERLRPQFHFSSQRGWLNDPNGLVYYQAEYHLFYQHNPYGWKAANIHWGHAVSTDLIHWKELGDALYPDAMGPMWSGSAVVDWKNTSGLGKDGQPPMVLLYTAAGTPTTQCLAYSLDGRTFIKYNGNPVVNQITSGNRDPDVFWYEPTQCWVMVLYVKKDGNNDYFLSSPNLKDWTVMSHIPFSSECPNFFELPVDGDTKNKKWVLTSAHSEYMVGTFDGTSFTPETPILRFQMGNASYAAQTYSDLPGKDGRRVLIGWLRAASPGMPFNQCMSIPIELKLVTTPDGPRMTSTPVEELKTLRGKTDHIDPFVLSQNAPNPLANVQGDLLEICTKFSPINAGKISLNVCGASIIYDVTAEEFVVNCPGAKVPLCAKAPLCNGSQQLTLYLDRTSIEVFADGGLVYIPLAFIPKVGNKSVEISTTGGSAKIDELDAYQLNSAWK